MYCQKCNNVIKEKTGYCNVCGAKFDENTLHTGKKFEKDLKKVLNLVNENKYSKAYKRVKKLTNKDKTNVNYIFWRGYIEYMLEKYSAALDSFNNAIELDNDYIVANHWKVIATSKFSEDESISNYFSNLLSEDMENTAFKNFQELVNKNQKNTIEYVEKTKVSPKKLENNEENIEKTKVSPKKLENNEENIEKTKVIPKKLENNEENIEKTNIGPDLIPPNEIRELVENDRYDSIVNLMNKEDDYEYRDRILWYYIDHERIIEELDKNLDDANNVFNKFLVLNNMGCRNEELDKLADELENSDINKKMLWEVYDELVTNFKEYGEYDRAYDYMVRIPYEYLVRFETIPFFLDDILSKEGLNKALDYNNKLINFFPNEHILKIYKLDNYIFNEKYDKAEEEIKKIEEIKDLSNEELIELYNRIGILYVKEENYDKACDEVFKLIEISIEDNKDVNYILDQFYSRVSDDEYETVKKILLKRGEYKNYIKKERNYLI